MAESRAEALPEYLEESLHVLEREAPVHFAAVKSHLGKLTSLIRIGRAASVRVCLAEGPPWTRPGSEGDIELTLSERDIEPLLLGALTIEEALIGDRLAVSGCLHEVLAFLDALQAWLHGAIRSPSMSQLHDRYLACKGP